MTRKVRINNTLFTMKQKNPIILAVIILLFAGFISTEKAYSQGKNEEVTIVAPYKPEVAESHKINFSPSIPDQMLEFPALTYSIHAQRVNTSVIANPIMASKKPPEKYKDLKRAFIRAGFGNYTTPYFELFLNSLQNEDFNFGVHLKHISSLGKIKDHANSTYSKNYAEIFGNKMFKKQVLNASASYKRDVNHYYGFIPDDFPAVNLTKDDLKHRIQTFSLSANLKGSNPAKDAIEHDLGIDYYYLSDNYKTSEQNIRAFAMLGKRFQMFNITKYQTIGADIEFDNYINDDTISSYSGGIFKVSPFISTDFNQFRFYAGFDLSYKADSSSKLYFYPKIRAEINIVKDKLILYGDISGGIKRVSYKDLSDENPFIKPIVNLDYRNNQFVIAAGLYGNVAERVNFLFEFSNSTIKNLPLFVNDSTFTNNNNIHLNNQFKVVYDNANLFRLRGELNHCVTNKITVGLAGEYNAWSMKTESKAWHRPALAVGFTGNFIIQEKFILGSEIMYKGNSYAKVWENNAFEEKDIDPWIDLSLSLNYLISDNISAFVNANNILNQGYQYFYNYPVQKFNIMAGVGFSF